MIEGSDIGAILSACLDCSEHFFGDGAGAFSGIRARATEAEAELERRGLGARALGLGVHHVAGDAVKLISLAQDAEMGNADAFEGAMRYVMQRVFCIDEFPPELAGLIAGVLLGTTPRPQKRKAKETGLRSRNLAVYSLVEIAREGAGLSAQDAYTTVAGELLKRGRNPNSPLTVKKIHLAMRRQIGNSLTPYDLAVLVSLPVLPVALSELAERILREGTRKAESKGEWRE